MSNYLTGCAIALGAIAIFFIVFAIAIGIALVIL